jgi:hypothetical protein
MFRAALWRTGAAMRGGGPTLQDDSKIEKLVHKLGKSRTTHATDWHGVSQTVRNRKPQATSRCTYERSLQQCVFGGQRVRVMYTPSHMSSCRSCVCATSCG